MGEARHADISLRVQYREGRLSVTACHLIDALRRIDVREAAIREIHRALEGGRVDDARVLARDAITLAQESADE